MSYRCQKCFRPESHCLCKFTKEIKTGIKFIFLMHPKEYKKNRTGTGRLAKNSLPDSEIIVGIDFSKNEHFMKLLNDPKYFPVLMYPGEDAWNAKKEGFKEALENKILLPILIDATWFCSRKVLEHSPFLLDLPKVSFAGSYRSIFTIKREPKPECVSTIETCYYLIKELQEAGLAAKECDPEPLMTVFKEMIKDQIKCENDRINGLIPNSHANDWKYTKPKELPDFLKECAAVK